VEIDTKLFGIIRINPSELIEMRGCILGFELLKRFVLLAPDDNSPFLWLQSVETPAIAFVVINPHIVKMDYDPPISKGDLELLNIQRTEEVALLSITTVRSDPFRATTNLRAPILINSENRCAKQIVIEDSVYPIQYDILDNKTDLKSKVPVENRMEVSRPFKLHPAYPSAG
jgi:flagellar assembly factor FliW